MRPISLLSCLAKTCERAVLRRLQYQLGPPHPCAFAYTRKTGATENIATILSLTEGKSAIIVFLDIEKAFELANAEAVLSSLAGKGVTGKLLSWLQDFLHHRVACTRFQGCMSETRTLENGTPQGSILSPTLFNALMENLLSLPFRTGIHLLAYADDLQLIATGPHKWANVQHALTLLEGKCADIALKINPAKSKVVPVGMNIPNYHLQVQQHRLQWADSHICLGIPFASTAAPRKVLDFLLTRTAARINVLRALTSTTVGAGSSVLRSFYIHAIRSIVDYAAPALLTLQPKFHPKLETIQNRSMRVILGAPMWTRLENLRMETGLVPLVLRVRQIVAGFTLKALRATRQFPFKANVIRYFDRHPDLMNLNIWSHAAVHALRCSHIPASLQVLREDRPHPQYTAAPPWSQPPATFDITPLPAPKALCTPTVLNAVAARFNAPREETVACFYTDGSVDPSTSRAGASVHCREHTACWRVSDHASTMQTELLAIGQALRHALLQSRSHIEIYTDSLSSLHFIRRSDTDTHTHLLTTILVLLRNLQQLGRSVRFVWVPSHCNIVGNERADTAAKTALHFTTITLPVLASVAQIKTRVFQQVKQNTLLQHYARVTHGSPSASWYRAVTRYDRLDISRLVPRETAVILHRIRLGYKCSWEIIEGTVRDCPHCDEEEVEHPLLHYLLHCTCLSTIRPPELQDYPLHVPDAVDKGILAARAVLDHPIALTSFPPPR